MIRILLLSFSLVLLMLNLCFGEATVFFKDGSKETGNTVWIEGSNIVLSKGQDVYQYPFDEVLLEQTKKHNRIGEFAVSTPMHGRDAVRQPATVGGDLVEQVLQASRFDQQMDMLVQQFQGGVQSVAGLPPELSHVLAQALAGFDPEAEKLRIRKIYRSRLDKQTLEAVLVWMKSPLGAKLLDNETNKHVYNQNLLHEIQEYQLKSPPSARRRALINEIDKAGRLTELAIRVMSDAAAGVMGGMPQEMNEKLGSGKKKELQRQLKAKMDEMKPEMTEKIKMAMFYTFKDFSDAELAEYAGFLKTKSARKFTKVNMDAVSSMTRRMSGLMMKNIYRSMERLANSRR